MNTQEVLEQAIKQAVEAGFRYNPIDANGNDNTVALIFDHDFAKAFWGGGSCYYCWSCLRFMGRKHKETCGYYSEVETYRGTGKIETTVRDVVTKWCYYYEYHLQQMVILPTTEERILYLEKGLR